MKFSIYLLIGAVYVVWMVVRAIRRQQQQQLGKRGGQTTNNSGNTGQNFFDNPFQSTAGEPVGPSQKGRSLETQSQPVSTITHPFLEARSMEAQKSHYDEELLVEEYTRTHAQGKTVAHHKHKLFDEKKDRKKAVHLSSSTRNAKSKKADSTKRPERREKKRHPVLAAIREKGGLRQAVIMAEILKRPED